MKITRQLIFFLLSFILVHSSAYAKGLSEDKASDTLDIENMNRTKQLVEHIEEYLKATDTYVGIIARRGSGDPKTGISDTDNLDLSGMAHSGFVIRNGFGKNAGYITFNLVREKGAKKVNGKEYDLSELRVWTLPHFFIGAFEKDAIVFLPEKQVQLKLWNLLRANGQLQITPQKRCLPGTKANTTEGGQDDCTYTTDQIISNGAFALLHNPEYNLLSDFTESSTQNCNEHLLKTYIGFRDYWQPNKKGYDIVQAEQAAIDEFAKITTIAIEKQFSPRQMVLSRTKSTFAFTQNIRFGERHDTAPAFFGIKLKKERFEVVSVDSFCSPENQNFLKWAEFKVFRENHTPAKGWYIEDKGNDYIKVNRFSHKPNKISEI